MYAGAARSKSCAAQWPKTMVWSALARPGTAYHGCSSRGISMIGPAYLEMWPPGPMVRMRVSTAHSAATQATCGATCRLPLPMTLRRCSS